MGIGFWLAIIGLTWACIGIKIARKKSQEIEWLPMGPDD